MHKANQEQLTLRNEGYGNWSFKWFACETVCLCVLKYVACHSATDVF